MNNIRFAFDFRFAGYGRYIVTYTTPTRRDYWRAHITDMTLIDDTKNAEAPTIAARTWLRASHEFYGQDGDPIRCTGWQFVGYNIAAAVVAVLLSIKY